MKIKTSELEGAALDWAAAKACEHDVYISKADKIMDEPAEVMSHTLTDSKYFAAQWSPSTDWSHGGPLISAHRASIIYQPDDSPPCAWTDDTAAWSGSTPLIAAMRAIVAAKLGDTVEVPDELL